MLLKQFDSHFLELYAKENMIMGLQNKLYGSANYTESDDLSMYTQRYMLHALKLLEFGEKHNGVLKSFSANLR